MSLISQEKINEVRISVDIINIISRYLPLTKRGKNYFGVCPFHDDHSPSMSVSSEKQIYTCFSCGATGNAFKFLMDYENISYVESIKRVAEIAGISIDIGPSFVNDSFKNNEMYEIYELSNKFYQNNISTSNGVLAQEYLKKRDIDSTIIKEFEIGLALKERNLLSKLLINKNFDQKKIMDSGLVVKNNYGLNDIYYNRIMFPLHNLNGQVVGYSGRIFDNSDNSKYINTKETEIFKKGEILYNYHRAKDECRSKNVVIVVEGFMDVIRAYTIGVKNVVATMGTAVTKKQAQLIKRLARDVILCFDGDSAGEKATAACATELINIGVIPKIVRLEDNQDPDDYIRKNGKEKFLLKLNNPINIMDFKLSYLKTNKDFKNNEDVSKYINDVILELSNIDDEILRELTLKKISEESKLDINFLKDKLNEKSVKKDVVIRKEIKPIKMDKYQKAEQYLIYYMLRSKEVIKMYNRKITYMPTDKYRFLAREISCYYKIYKDIDVADFITFLNNNNNLINTVGEIISLNLKDEYIVDEIDDYINVIKEYNINYELNRLKKLIEQEIDPVKKAEIGQKIIELKKDQNN